MYEVIISTEFAAAHALRHYYGETEPLHGHNFKVELVVRGKVLQNKVKYLTDFVALQKALQAVVQPMDHTNLNELPYFQTENPSAENLAAYVAGEVARRWSEPGVRLHCVTVWETAATAARFYPEEK
jgi:6-pyruvoyltetrahydropterin/6-carboxytetrahydropterin synthase